MQNEVNDTGGSLSDYPAMVEQLYSEVRLLRTLSNQNIIALYHVWRDDHHNTLNFITEVCTSGNLREYRKKHRQVSMKALKKWSKQILKGLHYLCNHEPCIIHRDLNCSNVFVNGNTGQESFLLISDSVNCSSENATISGFNRVEFVRDVGYAVGNVTTMALRNRGFGIWETGGVYALAQCWESLSTEGCQICLEKAENAVKSCPPKKEGRAMNAGCYLRYSTEKFYGKDSAHRHWGIWVTSAIVLATIDVSMLFFSAIYALYARISRIKREPHNLEQITLSFNKSGLGLKYETLEKAIDYFIPSRKLGQGGNGSVFMWILSNGRIVVVKILIFNTRQWVFDFFNEVNLISGIQHKNLGSGQWDPCHGILLV